MKGQGSGVEGQEGRDSDSPSCSGVCEPYMGVLDPVPYMGVWEPYMGVRLWAEVIPLCLLAPLQRRGRSGRVIDNNSQSERLNLQQERVRTHMVVSRCRSTEMVWQVEWSSTRAVDSVASFTTPM